MGVESRFVSQVPRLPPELQDMIMDYLHDDKPSLLSCSLVCRCWIYSSRHHLLQSIYIIEGRWAGHGVVQFASFLEELVKAGRDLLFIPHVHELHVLGTNGDVHTLQVFERPNVSSCAIARILTRLSRLRGLELAGLQLQKSAQSNLPCSKAAFKLSKLSLAMVSGSGEESLEDFLSVLRLFRHVENLRLSGVELDVEDEDQEGVARTLSSVELPKDMSIRLLVLDSDSPGVNLLCELFRRVVAVGILQRLRVTCHDLVDVAALGELINTTGVMDLELQLNPGVLQGIGGVTPVDWKAFQLSSCPYLKSIGFTIDSQDLDLVYHLLNAQIDILSIIPSQVSIIIFIIYIYDGEAFFNDVDKTDWARMDAVLDEFSMKHVLFQICDLMQPPRRLLQNCQDLLTTKLPRLKKRNSLHLRFLDASSDVYEHLVCTE
ncbi:hypothetical protein BKA93DRAFT_403773 [Sparassis latifolia]